MPWDGCELWVATVAPDGRLRQSELVAGGPDESIFQPEWSPDGTLYFVSDRTGHKELYVMDYDGQNPKKLTADRSLCMSPAWILSAHS